MEHKDSLTEGSQDMRCPKCNQNITKSNFKIAIYSDKDPEYFCPFCDSIFAKDNNEFDVFMGRRIQKKGGWKGGDLTMKQNELITSLKGVEDKEKGRA